MKNFFHLDQWAEIPAGKFLVGLSVEQRSQIIERMHQLGMYDGLSQAQLQLLKSIRQKHWKRTEYVTEWFRKRTLTGDGNYDYPGVGLSDDENALYMNSQLMNAFYLENLMHDDIPLETELSLDKFYIARFQVTKQQYASFVDGVSIDNIPGVLDSTHEIGNNRRAARVDPEISLLFCSKMGARLPNANEWEKAARGVDGRLYPWGNEWNAEAGYFYYGQPDPADANNHVDGYPKGISPFGVWGMAGSENELITNIMGNISSKGFHPKESSDTSAWFNHIIPMPGRGSFVGLRPVLDKWPQRQWTGFSSLENQS